MEFKLFSDLINVLGKVIADLANIPKREREKYRKTIHETYLLIGTTMNMVIIRLGDIHVHENDDAFIKEVIELYNYDRWLNAEREFRLCKSLRVALSEAEKLRSNLTGKLSIKDWDALLEQMRSVLKSEYEIAEYIGDKFRKLANFARNAVSDSELQEVKKNVEAFRDALMKDREQLIQQEIKLYDIV